MAQFDVYVNSSSQSQGRVPYLLDVQNDMLKHLRTRVVIPIVVFDQAISHLNPVVIIDDTKYMLSTQETAGVPLDILEEKVVSLRDSRDEIIHAIDFLITGF